jgi:hypothetical protein
VKERHKRAHVIGEAEEKGSQQRVKEEEKKKTHMLKKGDRRQKTQAASNWHGR